MTNCLRTCLGMAVVFLVAPSLKAGEFDRLEVAELARIFEAGRAIRHERLTVREIGGLPAGLSDTRSAFLVVKTEQGNYTRILATPAFRRSLAGEGGVMRKGFTGTMSKGDSKVLPVLV